MYQEAKFVYVAGPYSDENPDQVWLNVQRAEQAGKALMLKGHFPFIPHTMTNGLGGDADLDYEDFLRLGLAWVKRCDWFLYLGPSPGADRELAEAQSQGMPVFYSVDEVPKVSEPSSPA